MNHSDTEAVIEMLEKIGLTALQAKTYITLYYSGNAKAFTISKMTNMDRSNTYRTILQLQNIGLIAKVLGSPNIYQALPLKEAVAILVSLKKNEYNKIQSLAEELVDIDSRTQPDNQPIEYEFKMVKYKKETYTQAIIKSCENIQECSDLLISKKTLLEGLIDLAPNYLAGIRRGIKFRIITEKIDQSSILEKLKPFVHEPSFHIRYVHNPPKSEVVISDKRIANIKLVSNAEKEYRTTLIVNHSGCVEIFQNHFNVVWNQAREYSEELKV